MCLACIFGICPLCNECSRNKKNTGELRLVQNVCKMSEFLLFLFVCVFYIRIVAITFFSLLKSKNHELCIGSCVELKFFIILSCRIETIKTRKYYGKPSLLISKEFELPIYFFSANQHFIISAQVYALYAS